MRRLAFALIAVSAVAVGYHSPTKAAKPTYVKDVQPIMQKLCFRCHTGPNGADNIDLAKIKTNADAKKHLAVLKKGFKEMKELKMPPKGNPQPTPAQMKSFEAWLKTQK
jgi:hypothetical protein